MQSVIHTTAARAPARRFTFEKAARVCSLVGLATWALAIFTAVAQPLFGLQVSATWVMGLVGVSALFTCVAIPQLMRDEPSVPKTRTSEPPTLAKHLAGKPQQIVSRAA